MHNDNKPLFNTFNELLEVFKVKNEDFIYSFLCDISVVDFDVENKIFSFYPSNTTPKTLAKDIEKHLSEWTGNRWSVTFSDKEGKETINKKFKSELQLRKNKAIKDINVIKILDVFKGAEIIKTIEGSSKV